MFNVENATMLRMLICPYHYIDWFFNVLHEGEKKLCFDLISPRDNQKNKQQKKKTQKENSYLLNHLKLQSSPK